MNHSLVVQTVKNTPAMQLTRVWILSWEDSLQKGMTTPSSILAWRIPWTEKPGGLQSLGSQRVRHDLANNTLIFIDLTSKAKTIKLPKENIGEYLHCLETGNGFLERRQKVIIIKRKYDNVFHKIYKFYKFKFFNFLKI